MEQIKPEIAERIIKLEEKFKNSGQDMGSYLDGLLYDKYLTYWDYISLDTLLSLQNTKTHFPDEEIFITYHQITELYFKLIIHEQKQIIEAEQLSASFFIEAIIFLLTGSSICSLISLKIFDASFRVSPKSSVAIFKKQ